MEPTGASTVSEARPGFFASLFTFSGRARRSDVLALGALGCLAHLPRFGLENAGVGASTLLAFRFGWEALWAFLWLAVMVRRLHDQNLSGRWAVALFAGLCLIVLGFALQPQRDFGGLTISFMLWSFHPVASWMTTALDLSFVSMLIASWFLAFRKPTDGPNRYGPDPRPAPPQSTSRARNA